MKYFLETIYRRTPGTNSSLEESMKFLRKFGKLHLTWNSKKEGLKSMDLFYFEMDKKYIYPVKKISEDLQLDFLNKIKKELLDLGFENNDFQVEKKGKIKEIKGINDDFIKIEEKNLEKLEKKGKLSEGNGLDEHGYKKQLEFLENPYNVAFFNEKFENMTPREHQKEPIELAIKSLIEMKEKHGKGKGMLILPTGYGKTFITAAISDILNKIHKDQEKPFRILFLVHKNDIIFQTGKLFGKGIKGPFASYFNYDEMGIVIGDEKYKNLKNYFNLNNDNKVVIANIKTMENSMGNLSKDYFDLIIADECHRAPGPTYKSVINYFDYKYLLGVTATPSRTDEASHLNTDSIYKLFDNNVIFKKELSDAIIELILAMPYYFIRGNEITQNLEDEIRKQLLYTKYNGKIRQKRQKLEDNKDFNKDLTYLYNEKKKTIVFCQNIDIANETLEHIKGKYPSNVIMMFGREEYLNGKGKKLEKVGNAITPSIMEERILKFKDWNVDKKGGVFLVVVDLFIEGTDIPDVNAMMMLRPTESNRVYFQILGRGLRKTEEKDHCLVFDYNFETIKISLLNEKIELLQKLNLSFKEEKYKILYESTLKYINLIQEFIKDFDNLSEEEKNKFKAVYRQSILKEDVFPSIAKKIYKLKISSNSLEEFKKEIFKLQYNSQILGTKNLFIENKNDNDFSKIEALYDSNSEKDIIEELSDCYIHISNQLTLKSESETKKLAIDLTESQRKKLQDFLDLNPQIGQSYTIEETTNEFILNKFGRHTLMLKYHISSRKDDTKSIPLY